MIILSSDLCEQNVSNGYEEMMKVPSPLMDEVYPTFSIFSHSQTFKQALIERAETDIQITYTFQIL